MALGAGSYLINAISAPWSNLRRRQHVERAIAAGQGGSLALLYVDLDHFKPVNDRHGHAVGDEVLQRFAKRLRKVVRPTDGVARIGGHEFAVVMFGVPSRSVEILFANEILVVASKPFPNPGHEITVSVSISVAFGVNDVDGCSQLLARADANSTPRSWLGAVVWSAHPNSEKPLLVSN